MTILGGQDTDDYGSSLGHELGLSTAQAIAEMHGGRIAVDSSVGQGSEFVVHLLAAVSPAPAA